MTVHSFQTEHAKEYGINAAIILNHIEFWIEKNKADGRNQHDDRTWTYASIHSLTQIFAYMSVGHIRGALRKLESKGAILAGNYNKHAYDRTKWYALGKETPHLLKLQMDYKKITNTSDENPKPIPDNNTYIKDIGDKPKKPRFTPPTVKEVAEYCSSRTNNVDAERFVDFYEASGWMRGKNKIKSWKACVRTWEANDRKSSSNVSESINAGFGPGMI